MKTIKTICVFCASSESVDDFYKSIATQLGREMGKRGIDLVYGGASIGLMGCIARGVHEEKGKVTGVIPKFFTKEDIVYSEADELIVTQNMRERKAVMDERSDAFIVLPGGVGTLEEAIEILSMRQLKLTDKPLVFVNANGFYDRLDEMFKQMIDLNFAKENLRDKYAMVPDPQAALEYIFTP